MATIYELSDPKSNYLFMPLLKGTTYEICTACYCPIPNGHGYTFCPKCLEASQSQLPLADLVVPISMAIRVTEPDVFKQYPHELWTYKDNTNAAANDLQLGFAALIWRWLLTHEGCLLDELNSLTRGNNSLGSRFDLVTSVPSTKHFLAVHPLEVILKDVVKITSSRYKSTLAGVQGATQGRFVSERKFDLACTQQSILEKNILLVDDTWTTGANARSAAACLKSAGAASVVVLVLGRWLKLPTSSPYKEIAAEYIKDIKLTTWNWDSCVLKP